MFDKKYIAGIASFSVIAMNNVKASNNQKVHIRVDNNVYYNNGDTPIDIISVKDLENLFNIISSLGEIKKNGNDGTTKLNFADSQKKYFVKEVKVSGDGTNKLSDDLKIDLSAASADVEITLVPKRECIEFEYTSDKQLRKDVEDMLLNTVIQGKQLSTINVVGITDFGNSTLNNRVVKNGNEIIGSQVKVLDETNKIKFKIDSDKFGKGYCKSVVCKFNNDVKLVDGTDLEALYNLDISEIEKNNLNFTEVIAKLKSFKESFDTNTVTFFNDNFGFTVINGSDEAVNIKKSETSKNFENADFIILNDIKAADINPIFLKKNFTVEFDNSDDTDKKVDDNILDKIKNSLNKELSDKVVIKVSDITSEISRVINKLPYDIIVDKAFKTLNNISIVGVQNVTPNTLGVTDTVNAKDIKIKLKEGVFAKGIVKTEFNFDVNFDAVKKGDKGLNDTIVKIISGLKNGIKVFDEELQIECFLTDVNKAFKDYFLEGKKLDATDFDFSACKQNSTDTSLNKSGTIVAKNTIVDKLKDSCFEKSDKPKDKTEGSGNGTGSGDNNGDTSKKGYCGSTKK